MARVENAKQDGILVNYSSKLEGGEWGCTPIYPIYLECTLNPPNPANKDYLGNYHMDSQRDEL